MCIVVTSCVLLYCVYITILGTVVTRLLARSQYPEGPATGHLGTDFLCFPVSVYQRMLRWFPRHHVATAYFSCSPPYLIFSVPYFIFVYMHNNHCHRATDQLQLIKYNNNNNNNYDYYITDLKNQVLRDVTPGLWVGLYCLDLHDQVDTRTVLWLLDPWKRRH